MKRFLLLTGTLFTLGLSAIAQSNTFKKPGVTFGLPAAFENGNKELVLTWTEREENGNVQFLFAISKDEGKTFGEKQVIYSAPGIGTGRLAKPRLLLKKNGEMVAVFSINPDATFIVNKDEKPKRSRNSQIHMTISKDGGKTWTNPAPMHTDTDPKVRGFFDATLMANDEVAMIYLKDIPEQKHQRDLRIITTENGVPQEERIVDPFVCDCCNLGLLTDNKGRLNVYYRENQDDLRDISKVASEDNGQTFGKQSWVYKDNWQVKACPHNGPQAIRHGATNLIAYYAGKEGDQGVRIVNQEGDLLTKITDETVKFATLVGTGEQAVVLYSKGEKETGTQIGYRNIVSQKVSKEKNVKSAKNGTNPNGVFIGKKLFVVYEITEGGKSVGIQTEVIKP